MSDATRSRWSITGWIFVIAVIALLFGLWTQHNLFNKAQTSEKTSLQNITLLSGTLLPQPRAVISFELKDDHNKPFTNANLLGHWNFIFFGFTHCPDLCPTTLSTLNVAYKNLQASHLQPLPQVIFISVDPKRDTPQRIDTYMISFNPSFIGATGEKKQIDALVKDFNVMYAEIVPKGEHTGEYTIDHSGTILLVNPEGQLYAIFSTPHDASNIAKDFATIVANYQNRIKTKSEQT